MRTRQCVCMAFRCPLQCSQVFSQYSQLIITRVLARLVLSCTVVGRASNSNNLVLIDGCGNIDAHHERRNRGPRRLPTVLIKYACRPRLFTVLACQRHNRSLRVSQPASQDRMATLD